MGLPRVDDRRVVSGIVYVIRNGLQWKDAPTGYGPHKTLYNRFIRWSRLGVFDRIFAGLGRRRAEARADHDRRHPSEGPPHGGEPAQKGDVPRRIGRTKGGLNSKLHAVCDGDGRPLILLLSEGQMSDHKGARLVLDALPPARYLIADRGYDSAWFREALAPRGIEPCIPSTRSRKIPYRLRQGSLSPAPQGREPVRQAQGLAAHRHPLRPMRPHLLLGHLHRSRRHLLALINEFQIVR